MKKIFTKLMLLAVAATALASCANDDINDVTTLPGVEVSINATTEVTKSHFGELDGSTYPTVWSGSEKWAVCANDTKVTASDIEFSNGYTTANAKVTFDAEKLPVAINGKYTLFAVSPESQWVSVKMESDFIRFRVPGSQTPSATSCDEKAQVLIAHSEPAETLSDFNVTFKHAVAYGKFSFLNVAEGGNVSSVTIKSKDVALAGRYEYAPSTKTISFEGEASYEINLTTTATTDLWFACGAAAVKGKKLTFVINTDKGKLEKEVTMPGNFEVGKVATFNIDMAGIEYPVVETVVEWNKVTSLADITEGEYVIVDKTKVLPNAKVSNGPGFVELSAKATVGDDVLTNVDDSVIWVFTGSNTAMTIQSYADKTLYLYNTNANDGVQVNTTSTYKWAFEVWKTGFGMKTNSRYLGVYESGSDWRSYTTVNASNYGSDGACLTLYKKFSTEPIISASAITVAATGGEGESSYTITNMDSDDVTAIFATEWISTEAANGVITYEIEPNYTGTVRNGKITLSSAKYGITKDVTVTQAADQFKVSATSVSVADEANSTATFTVTSTYAATIAVADATKWSVTPTSIAGSASAVTVTVKALTANETAEAVTGAITITRTEDSKKLTVTASQAVAEQGGDEGGSTGGTHFVKVTSAPSDWSGTYLIVYETGKVAFDGSRTSFDAVSNTKSVTISNNQIEATDAMKAIAFTIAKNGSNYSIKGASGKYFGNDSNSNALTTSASAMVNTLAFVSANDITIKGKGGAYLRYNATSGQTRFRYYKSSSYTNQKAIQLYKLN